MLGAAGGGIGHKIGGRLMASVTHNPTAEGMAMGRAMTGRVIPYAESHGLGYFKGTPQVVHDGLEKIHPKVAHTVDLWVNKKWVNYQMMEGKGLTDIGEPPGMPKSDFYDMERKQVQGYPNYTQDLQP